MSSTFDSLGDHIGFAPEDQAIDPVEATRAVFGVADLLVDPSPWWASVSLLAHGLAGGDPSGVLVLHGPTMSGKSSIGALVASALGRRYINEPMCSLSASTPAAWATLGPEARNPMIVIDDVPPAFNRRDTANQAAALSALVRRASGGATGEEAARRSSTTGVTDLACPQILMLAEAIPPGLDESARSGMIEIGVTHSSTWKPGAWAERARPIGASGQTNRWASSFLRFVAKQVDANGWGARTGALADSGRDDPLAFAIPSGANSQQRETLRPLHVGLSLLQSHAESLGIAALDGHWDSAAHSIADVGESHISATR